MNLMTATMPVMKMARITRIMINAGMPVTWKPDAAN